MASLWSKTAALPSFPPLEQDLKTEVLIIGGGMAGLLCAYLLRQAGIECVLLEADTICSGVTQNTTAKITAQHGLIYQKLLKSTGADAAALYLRANQEALEQYASLAGNFDCDFERKDAYVYTLKSPEKIREEVDALSKIGYGAEFVRETPLPMRVSAAIKFANQAQLHPLKFAAGIAKGLPIYEHTKVCELSPHAARTKDGNVAAKKILLATHFPIDNKHGSYFMKMYQHRSYVLALEHAQDVDGMYVDEAKQGLSFRNYRGLLLLGGGSHRTGKRGGGYAELERFCLEHYPDALERGRWATQDCMSLDGVPYIGQYSKHTPDFFAATGFNKWGMTSSLVSANILVDLIRGRENCYTKLFSPSRSMLKPQLAINTFETLASLLRPSSPRCPHLGCALHWNSAEHSWDCACHGSRFDEAGHLLNNPANGDLKLD